MLGTGAHWYSLDGIAIIIVYDEEVIVASRGWGHKFSRDVAVEFAGWFKDRCTYGVGTGMAIGGGVGRGEIIAVAFVIFRGGRLG